MTLNKYSRSMLALLAITAVGVPALAIRYASTRNVSNQTSKGMAVAYPWVFEYGTDTARSTATTSAEEILRKAGYASVPGDVAKEAWGRKGLPEPTFGHLPSRASLRAFGNALHASKVLYGSVSWHTRSIWVNAGPKTISTAKVNAYVFDVKSGKVVFKKLGVEGRSDEKSNGYKIAADVLLTPLVTAVSGGPATPQEQRAVQIGLGLAYHSWVSQTD